MTDAILNNEKIATSAGDIKVYNYDGVTREYLSSMVEYLAVGVGILPTPALMHRVKAKMILPFAGLRTQPRGNM